MVESAFCGRRHRRHRNPVYPESAAEPDFAVVYTITAVSFALVNLGTEVAHGTRARPTIRTWTPTDISLGKPAFVLRPDFIDLYRIDTCFDFSGVEVVIKRLAHIAEE